MVDRSARDESSRPPIYFRSPDGLVTAHHYLCRRAARKFWRSGLERNDLEQVAALGLIKAARRFDPTLLTPFEAYAWIAIVGELMHHVRDHERAVRIPRRLRALETHYARALETLIGRLGREPNDHEIASAMGILAPTLAELRGAREVARPLAIEEASRLPMPAEVSVEDRLLFESAFAGLPQLERRVIAGVYVLGLTQLEVSRRLAISPKRVSRMHRGALAKMQRAWTQ